MTKTRTAHVHEVSVAEAKSRLSELLGRVASAGDRIVITKRGRPIAELVAPRGSAALPAPFLEHDDEFFDIVDSIVAARAEDAPRAGVPRPAARRAPKRSKR